MRVDPLEGQKTGLFLDQRDNRLALRRWVKGKRVLDAFCYNGAWCLSAAAGQAQSVVGVDESAQALEQAETNAARNGFESLCTFERSDVFRYLRNTEKGSFDVIVLDPPAFARNRNAVPEAVKGYTDLNRRALLAMNPGGILVTCSCSYHITEEMFLAAVLQASKASGKPLRLLEMRGQAADPPGAPRHARDPLPQVRRPPGAFGGLIEFLPGPADTPQDVIPQASSAGRVQTRTAGNRPYCRRGRQGGCRLPPG